MGSMNWAGNARGRITEFGVFEADSGAVAISIKAAIDAYFNIDTGKWTDCAADRFEEIESGNILNRQDKRRRLISKSVESLCQYAGWNGDLTSIVNGTWQPTPCSFVLNEEEYKGVKQFKISFLNAYDRIPGNVGNVTTEKAKALQDRFGASFRASAGNVQRNAAPPASKPPAPKPSGPKREPVSQGVGNGNRVPAKNADDITLLQRAGRRCRARGIK